MISFVTEKICFDIFCGDKFSDDMFCMGSAQVKENLSSHILEIQNFYSSRKEIMIVNQIIFVTDIFLGKFLWSLYSTEYVLLITVL